MNEHPLEAISAYADGELSGAERERVERHLAGCTECARELALIRSMGDAMARQREVETRDLWSGVHRRITQPIGWVLVVAGVVVWLALALTEWFRGGELTPQWLATTAVGIGLALLVVGVAHQQYREWRESPYKDVER
ncbi:MAG TPA: zf-HC2 domain-containing protein [Gemmatimonadaceae bacterium]|nr:zf-HC2 domain-containing protein [Gemmatimonadaceae bacterium]